MIAYFTPLPRVNTCTLATLLYYEPARRARPAQLPLCRRRSSELGPLSPSQPPSPSPPSLSPPPSPPRPLPLPLPSPPLRPPQCVPKASLIPLRDVRISSQGVIVGLCVRAPCVYLCVWPRSRCLGRRTCVGAGLAQRRQDHQAKITRRSGCEIHYRAPRLRLRGSSFSALKGCECVRGRGEE